MFYWPWQIKKFNFMRQTICNCVGNCVIAGNCVDYDLKSKTVKKAEFQNCVECFSPFPWTDRLTVSSRIY